MMGIAFASLTCKSFPQGWDTRIEKVAVIIFYNRKHPCVLFFIEYARLRGCGMGIDNTIYRDKKIYRKASCHSLMFCVF